MFKDEKIGQTNSCEKHIWTKPKNNVWQCSICRFMQNFEPTEYNQASIIEPEKSLKVVNKVK